MKILRDKADMETPTSLILTVSQLTAGIQHCLEERYEWVQVMGEISNYKKAPSGHAYFRLKDDDAVLECVAWKTTVARWSGLNLKDGDEVVVGGRLTLYPPRGQYQLVVSAIRMSGMGALQQRFEILKQRLAQEGLFAPERKQPLPAWIQHVAVITSPAGAAIHDFLRILHNSGCPVHVTVCPVPVQGSDAAVAIAEMIERVNRAGKHDLIVLCRGGGSLEDLWAFNEEPVARAIAASAIPVLTGIGHEIDFTIADFVADHRAPTPTGAAQVICDSFEQYRARLIFAMDRLRRGMLPLLQQQKAQLCHAQAVLRRFHPIAMISLHRRRMDDIMLRMTRILKTTTQIERARLLEKRTQLTRLIKLDSKGLQQNLHRMKTLLECHDPHAILSRGYALVRTPDGTVIRRIGDVQQDHQYQIRMADGYFDSRVLKVVTHHESQEPSAG